MLYFINLDGTVTAEAGEGPDAFVLPDGRECPLEYEHKPRDVLTREEVLHLANAAGLWHTGAPVIQLHNAG